MDSRGPGFARRCQPLPAAARLKARAAGPKKTLDASGLEAWRHGGLGRPEGLKAWLKLRRLVGLAAWAGSLTRSTLGEVGGLHLAQVKSLDMVGIITTRAC